MLVVLKRVAPILLGSLLLLAETLGASEMIDFNRDIRPILSENCFLCHGPDPEERKGGRRGSGGLRLDTEAGALMDLGGYTALAPGDPEDSELLFLIETEDEEERMPPSKHGERLDGEAVALLKRWIEEGGTYDRHWSYQPVERPAVPAIDSSDFVLRNSLDHFVARRLESEGLTQSPEADRNALARRVALDVTGLPPTLEEVDAFLADGAPGAYERFVDRQLAKLSYGEHWARMWLDLARYADSAGYANDPLRDIWAFRDYVIRSFNENKPFDQFTIEQIAGDLLEKPTIDQKVATAFHRNTKTNSEGGTDDAEFRNEAIVDRVNTTMSVWMGTTMACAQCHTHKYDPITQEEYFEMFAILNSTADEDRKDEGPVLALFSEADESKREALDAEIAKRWDELESTLSGQAHRERRGEWEARLRSGGGWRALSPGEEEITIRSKASFSVREDGLIEVGENLRPTEQYKITVEPPEGINTLTGVKLEALPAVKGDLAWVLSEIDVKVILEGKTKEGGASEEGGGQAAPAKNANKPLRLINGSASYEEPEYRVNHAYDGVRSNHSSGWAVDGNMGEANEAVFELAKPARLPEGAKIEITLSQVSYNRAIKRFRLFVSDEVKPMPARPKDLEKSLAKSRRSRTPTEETALLEYFARYDPESLESHRAIATLESDRKAIKPFTTVPVMKEVSKTRIRKTYIQNRGNFLDQGKEVGPGLPSAFHEHPAGAALDRLDLARWLIDEKNPLTARVVANRYWEALFGTGIVATSEEFGSQGELPSHPELLDWLAAEFVESGWDIKHLLKMIVSSATYRQSSTVDEEGYQRDPDNRLLARGPRFRISAEMIRDQALAVSGLLSEAMFGPPVNPPQPKLGLKTAFGDITDWDTSEGEDKFRRGIYTSWRRSNPYPSMATFDAPNREVCVVRRERTNTPLQALVTLNDPVYIEAAQALGRRMASFEGGAVEKVAYGFQLCLARAPSSKESGPLERLYLNLKPRYAADPEKAMEMASNPIGPIPEGGEAAEYAAWTVVANALLNLDEMFLKR